MKNQCFWLPDPGFQILTSRFWIPDPGSQILATRSWVPDLGCQILTPGSWLYTKKQYQTLGPKFFSSSRKVIKLSKNDPLWDLKTDSGSSRRALAFSGLKTRLGAKKRHFFENWYATLESQVPFFSRLFLHLSDT